MQLLDEVSPQAPLDERSQLISKISQEMKVPTDVADGLLDLMRNWNRARKLAEETDPTPPSDQTRHVLGTPAEITLHMRIYLGQEADKHKALAALIDQFVSVS